MLAGVGNLPLHGSLAVHLLHDDCENALDALQLATAAKIALRGNRHLLRTNDFLHR